MYSYYENVFSMLRTVQDFLKENTAIWTASVPFTTAYNTYTALIAEIQALIQIIELDRKGITEAKAQKEGLMIGKAIFLRNAAIPYANSINDVELSTFFDVSESKLEKLRDTILVEKAQGFHDKGVTIAAGLVPYGIDAAWLADFQAYIDNYDGYVTKPRTAIAERKTANTQVMEKIKAGRDVLTGQIDYLVENYKTTFPAFAEGYKNARIVIDLAGGRSEVEAGVLAELETANVFSDVENKNRFKFENPGSTIIRYCRTNIGTIACDAGVEVAPGETVAMRADEMAASGEFLNVTNTDGSSTGKYKVSRD